MPRRARLDDDYGEYELAPKRKKANPNTMLLVVIAVVVVGLVVLCGGVTLMFFYGAGRGANQVGRQVKEEGKKAVSRNEFRRLVIGKTPAQVIAAVGKPDQTTESNGVPSMWLYRNRTRDLVTGKVDSSAALFFQNGVVDDVTY